MRTEKYTDHIIFNMMTDAGMKPEPESTQIREVQEALRTASKHRTGEVGKPEFIAQVGQYLIIVEDKKDSKYQGCYMTDKKDTLLMDIPSIVDYAENGALHYAQHIIHKTNFKKAFAFGCSGTDKENIKIRPIYVSEKGYKILPFVRDFSEFSDAQIGLYFQTKVLENKSEAELEFEQVMSSAEQLHEDLRNYASLSENEKPVIVSGLLLALRNPYFRTDKLSLSIEEKKQIGEKRNDGEIVYDAIVQHMEDMHVEPEKKKEQVLNQFHFIKLRPQLSAIHPALGKSPLKYFAEYIYSKVLTPICNNTPDDVLGEFYKEFLRYSGGDGKGLGIVLTPSHITQLMVDLLKLKHTDKVLDPCSGTGGFLVASMFRMLEDAKKLATVKEQEEAKIKIKKTLLHGIEMDERMFSIATTNMILRGDGKANLECADFLNIPTEELRKRNFTVGLMNPPYSQAKNKLTAHLSELNFIKHLLDSLADGARCAVIVPQSTMVGKTKIDANIKSYILEHHTLEGVITLNTQTFYPVGTNPVIAIFTAHEPHEPMKKCKFIDFKVDGYEVQKHWGLVDNGTFADKRKRLLDIWRDYVDNASTSEIVKSRVNADDEWLHSFYYFNDEIPTDKDFEKTMADYLSFEFKMVVNGKGYLFGYEEE
jgi:type I restriction-modification system DNA methylase subunit